MGPLGWHFLSPLWSGEELDDFMRGPEQAWLSLCREQSVFVHRLQAHTGSLCGGEPLSYCLYQTTDISGEPLC